MQLVNAILASEFSMSEGLIVAVMLCNSDLTIKGLTEHTTNLYAYSLSRILR